MVALLIYTTGLNGTSAGLYCCHDMHAEQQIISNGMALAPQRRLPAHITLVEAAGVANNSTMHLRPWFGGSVWFAPNTPLHALSFCWPYARISSTFWA